MPIQVYDSRKAKSCRDAYNDGLKQRNNIILMSEPSIKLRLASFSRYTIEEINRLSVEIKKMWQLFPIAEDSILELRAIAPQKTPVIQHFRAKKFQSIDELSTAFELAALKLNHDGYNIYTTLNPIKPSFNGEAATDADIEHRDLLLIDIDRVGSPKQPATDKEVKAAKQLAKGIIAYLAALGWPNQPIQVMSGNGWHIYWQLDDLVNDNETTELIKQTLKLLAKHFNNTIVTIDTVVYNASRITKVPGTVMRKGDESEGRPYRMAVVHE